MQGEPQSSLDRTSVDEWRRYMITRVALGLLIGAGFGSLTGYFGKCSSGTCPLTATPLRGAVYGGVLGLLFAFSWATPSRKNVSANRAYPNTAGDGDTTRTAGATTAVPGTTAANDEGVLSIVNPTEFESRVLRATVPCLVDFYSDHCPPCRMLAPMIENLAERYRGRALICKMNLDARANAGVARRYGIRAIPAVFFFQRGKEVERLIGLQDKNNYTTVLDRLLPTKPVSGTGMDSKIPANPPNGGG